MADGSAFSRMAMACLELRMQMPQRLWPAFAVIEEAALKHAITTDGVEPRRFRCDVDESGGLADVLEFKRG